MRFEEGGERKRRRRRSRRKRRRERTWDGESVRKRGGALMVNANVDLTAP